MRIVVLADESLKEEFLNKKTGAGIDYIFIENYTKLSDHDSADAFFILQEEVNLGTIKHLKEKPVFINSVTLTLKDLRLSENFSRINAWPTFLFREKWEVATNDQNLVNNIFKKLGWEFLPVADEPGLMAARIISVIINEAYFALGEDVSTKDEIDLAMKLGTNYPYGPFEWSAKIGLKNIHDLLKKLSEKDSRYNIAPEMERELFMAAKTK